MKVLILGGLGMLGHKLCQVLSRTFDTYATFRSNPQVCIDNGMIEQSHAFANVSVEDFATVEAAFEAVRPSVVINCIGVIKQLPAGKDPVVSININSLFPHRLAKLCRASDARLIHLSTDCVFSGGRGNYSETELPDPPDLYGRSKLLGEVEGSGCLTIRTSMIGRELTGAHGLVEWFLAQRGTGVRGFKRAVFSGFTTEALARIISDVLIKYPELSGVWHIAAEPISKFDLLTLVKQTYGLAIEIEPENDFVCDRSLDSTRFRAATGIQPPSWPEMIEDMHADPTPYEEIRSTNT